MGSQDIKYGPLRLKEEAEEECQQVGRRPEDSGVLHIREERKMILPKAEEVPNDKHKSNRKILASQTVVD